jgi:hypothetical protein
VKLKQPCGQDCQRYLPSEPLPTKGNWSQFYEYQFNQSQDMLANMTSVENLVRQLKDLEETIAEVQTTKKIVSILPSRFQHFSFV